MSVRVEQCQCGGSIHAESLVASRPQVAMHNMTIPHLRWRLEQGILTPSLHGAPPDDPRRRLPTADDDACDVSRGTSVRPQSTPRALS